jgi:hypothetical protein
MIALVHAYKVEELGQNQPPPDLKEGEEMSDLLLKLWREVDMSGERKAKREARAKSYWLGHSMSRFTAGISVCKICDATMELTVDGVRGEAVEKHCTQQTMEWKDETKEEKESKAHRLRTTRATTLTTALTTSKNGIGTFCPVR